MDRPSLSRSQSRSPRQRSLRQRGPSSSSSVEDPEPRRRRASASPSTPTQDDVVCEGALWRDVKVESVFDLFRELQKVKEEPGAHPREHRGRNFDNDQLRFLNELKDDVRDFDPSRSKHALQEWGHLLKEVEVQQLRHTHDEISETFSHGAHKGQSVEKLSQDLSNGLVHPRDITPLVAIKWDRKVWVILGNRRLKALKDFQKARMDTPVAAKCIIHECRDTPRALIAKFLLAWSTTNHGLAVAVRKRQSPSRRNNVRSRSRHRERQEKKPAFVNAHCDRNAEEEFSLDPGDWRDCDRFGFIPSEDRTFYLRFYAGHKGKHGHEYLQFDVHANGRVRFANVSRYSGFHPVIKKECNVSAHLLNVLKALVDTSNILQECPRRWPRENGAGRQDLELLRHDRRVTFTTCKTDSSMTDSHGAAFWRFCLLVADIRSFMLWLLAAHFRINRNWHFDPRSAHDAPLSNERGEGPTRSIAGWVVFVAGVHEDADELDVVDAFTDFGAVKENAPFFQSKGVKRCVFITYPTQAEAEDAIRGTDGSDFLGETLTVGWAFSKRPTRHR